MAKAQLEWLELKREVYLTVISMVLFLQLLQGKTVMKNGRRIQKYRKWNYYQWAKSNEQQSCSLEICSCQMKIKYLGHIKTKCHCLSEQNGLKFVILAGVPTKVAHFEDKPPQGKPSSEMKISRNRRDVTAKIITAQVSDTRNQDFGKGLSPFWKHGFSRK